MNEKPPGLHPILLVPISVAFGILAYLAAHSDMFMDAHVPVLDVPVAAPIVLALLVAPLAFARFRAWWPLMLFVVGFALMQFAAQPLS